MIERLFREYTDIESVAGGTDSVLVYAGNEYPVVEFHESGKVTISGRSRHADFVKLSAIVKRGLMIKGQHPDEWQALIDERRRTLDA